MSSLTSLVSIRFKLLLGREQPRLVDVAMVLKLLTIKKVKKHYYMRLLCYFNMLGLKADDYVF